MIRTDKKTLVYTLVRMTEFLYKLCIGLRRESPDREIGAREGEMLHAAATPPAALAHL
jgi:hypothetical protein